MKEWRSAGILASTQFVSYVIICWNMRAIAKGWIGQAVVSDVIFAAINFKLFKRVAAAQTDLAWFGYVVGGAAGSAVSIYLTKRIWGQ